MFPEVPEQFSPADSHSASTGSQHLDDGELTLPSFDDSRAHLVLDLGALVGAIPYLARYTPREGVVVLMVRDSQVVLTTVTQSVPSPMQADSFWRGLSASMHSAQAQKAVIVAYADPAAHLSTDPRVDSPSLAQTGLPAQTPRDADLDLLELAARCPLPVLGVARVQGTRWWDLNPAAEVPLDGRPIVVDEGVASAFIGLAGRAPASSREALGAFLIPGPAPVRARIAAALQKRREKLARGRDGGVPVWDHARVTQATAGWAALQAAHLQRMGGPVGVNEAEAVQLLEALSLSIVRDACMDWFDDAAWWLWTGLMPLAPDSHVANLGSLIALAAYCRGDGGTANVTLEHVLRVDPGHTLARLLREMFTIAAAPADIAEMTASASRKSRSQLKDLATIVASSSPSERARTSEASPSPDEQGTGNATHDTDGACSG